jgi:hypothetical protein
VRATPAPRERVRATGGARQTRFRRASEAQQLVPHHARAEAAHGELLAVGQRHDVRPPGIGLTFWIALTRANPPRDSRTNSPGGSRGSRSLSRYVIVCRSPAAVVVAAGVVERHVVAAPALVLGFDAEGAGQTLDLRPTLPVILRW